MVNRYVTATGDEEDEVAFEAARFSRPGGGE